MTARKTMRDTPHLVVMPTAAPDTDVIGFHPVPDHLPAVHRFPGETVAQLIQRALGMATGSGPFLAHLKIKDAQP
jgi:hypothetical protein